MRAAGGSSASNAPDVAVNGIAATVVRSASPGATCPLTGICWWDFQATLALEKSGNPNVVTAIGKDRTGGTDSDSVTGNIDLCLKGTSDGLAIVGASSKQANRCHEIDGCSTPEFLVSDVQDPAAGTLGRRSTAFGKDTLDDEFAPHGNAPKDDLPCNHHDVCYQTCGSKKLTCDADMFDRMKAVCTAAYPETTCPYLPNLVKCANWSAERDNCHRWAARYRTGLSSPPALTRFNLRQDDFCRP
jgi:hypothetical protein